MTTTIERSIMMNASPEAVAAVTDKADLFIEWFAGLKSIDPDNTFPREGGAADVVYKAAGVSFKAKISSLEYNYGRGAVFQLDGMISGTNRWIYQPEGQGTKVTYILEYDMPGGGIGKALNRLVVERMNEENVEKTLANLKVVVESS